MKRYLFSTIMLLLMLIISACGSKDSIVGSWENSSEGTTIIFEKDGKWDVFSDGYADDEVEGGGTYTLSENTLTLHYDDGGYVEKCNIEILDKVLKIIPLDENGNEIPDWEEIYKKVD